MGKNQELHDARTAKKDEFYTQLVDVEKEMVNYTNYFEGKIVYCNCDNPRMSAFWEYFHKNFEKLKLKKLVSTYYSEKEPVYKSEYGGGNDQDISDCEKTLLKGNGDFSSEECQDILNGVDIVCSNPPFSLFRRYVSILMQYGKQFIILGNLNAITYKEIFPLIQNNKLWFGPSIHSGDREFMVPEDYPLKAAGYRIDNNGKKYIRVKGVRWFSNLDTNERHKELYLEKAYTKEEFPYYDNYPIINVDKTCNIPKDYFGIMGVPITFFDKYCPDQFEILGIANSARWIGQECFTIIDGKKKYNRLLIRQQEK